MAKKRRRRKKKSRIFIAYLLRTICVLVILAAAIGLFLGGKLLVGKLLESNSSTEVLSEDTIVVKSKGQILGSIVEAFDENTYSANELESMLDSEVSDYNSIAGSEEAVKVKSFNINDNVAQIDIAYESAADYRSFNGTALYVGTVDEIAGKGVLFDKELIDAAGGANIPAGSTAKIVDMKAVAISESAVVKVPGKLLYYSSNVEPIDKKSVRVSQNEEGMAFILYK